MVLDGVSFEEYPLNACVSQGSILDPTLFMFFFKDLLMMSDAILLFVLMKLLSTCFLFPCFSQLSFDMKATIALLLIGLLKTVLAVFSIVSALKMNTDKRARYG